MYERGTQTMVIRENMTPPLYCGRHASHGDQSNHGRPRFGITAGKRGLGSKRSLASRVFEGSAGLGNMKGMALSNIWVFHRSRQPTSPAEWLSSSPADCP